MTRPTAPARGALSVALPLSLAALLAAGCGLAPQEPAAAGSAARPIIKGTPASPELSGHVKLRSGGRFFCSGTLVTNDCVVTARHCLFGRNAATIEVEMGPQKVGAVSTDIHPALDVGVIRTRTPGLAMPVAGGGTSRTGYRRALYAGTTASLAGKTVQCYGYGRYGTSCSASGPSGKLHTATLVIQDTSASHYYLTANASGQIPHKGDSGSGCFHKGALTGVHSGGHCPTRKRQVAVPAFRDALLAACGIPATRPDLRADRLSATLAGGKVTIALRICQGSAAAGPVRARLWLDLPAAPTCGTAAAADLEGDIELAPGACVDLTLPPIDTAGVPPGTYRPRLMVDALCKVAEADETNNVASATVVIP